MRQLGINKGVVSGLVLALVLTACKSTPMKEVEEPVKEEVKEMVEPVAAVESTPKANTGEIKEMVIDEKPTYSYVSPLNDPNNILSSRSVYFDYDSDAVKAEYLDLVNAHATYLAENPGAKVRLVGNTDDRGTREYNLSLGQRRAVAVKKALNLSGISDMQLETVSYGEERSNTACADSNCYSVDRRVDIVYTSEQ